MCMYCTQNIHITYIYKYFHIQRNNYFQRNKILEVNRIYSEHLLLFYCKQTTLIQAFKQKNKHRLNNQIP